MSTEALLEFLSDPKSYPDRPSEVGRIETHVSWVFVTKTHVYKVKKPIKLDFLDCSTLDARGKACRREVRLNRRLAGNTYLGVLPIYEQEGHWSFAGPGVPREYCVRMKRLPEDRMLDRLAVSGQISSEELSGLVEILARFYQTARTGERIARGGSAETVEANVRANLKALRTLHPEAELLDCVESAQLEFVGRSRSLLDERSRQGKVRDGHGDLRAEHICMTSPPVIFDCIDFNDRLRHLDVLDDLAFLSMDMDMLGREDLGQSLWSMLAARLGEGENGMLFDFYRSYRACVRAKVQAIRDSQLWEAAAGHVGGACRCCQYLEKAAQYCRRFQKLRLLVTVGVMGTGKSTLAQALASALGLKYVSSDEVGSELLAGAGGGPSLAPATAPLDESDAVYAELRRRARQFLEGRISVILDATFPTRRHRAEVMEVARSIEALPLFLECRVPRGEAIVRVDRRFRRRRSGSGRRPDLYDEQIKLFQSLTELPPVCVLPLNTSQSVAVLIREVLQAL